MVPEEDSILSNKLLIYITYLNLILKLAPNMAPI